MTDETAQATDNEVGSAQGQLTVSELREWLRNWVADATGQSVDKITDDRPMEEFGLASRDAIALSGDIEELTGVMLTATVVYQHPTIASLSEIIINGEPEEPEPADESYVTAYQPGTSHDVAIVGLSTRLPKAGSTPESTWDFLIGGGDGISDLPEGRWSEFLSDPRLAEAVAAGHTRGGYLDDLAGFDAEFFAMSPTEVARVDPQQRMALELTWEALEHARIPASALKGERVGVFVGTSSHDWTIMSLLDSGASDTPYGLTGAATSIVANRISYFYDFRGPSLSVDTACSSTLVAVHQAVRALRGGEADVALAGGVNVLVAPMVTLGFDNVGAVAKDGRIKAFSSDADGMVRSEGGGLVVLKRLEDAERDGDQIYAVIAGSAVNSDGRSNGIVAPNPDAQADVLRAAYRDAGIHPGTVDYVDAHGTGTILGDPIEADALGRVVGRGRADDKPLLLGSAKTNFGHLESGAGAASLAKVVMSFQHNVIPPSINYAGPNPYIPFDKAHLEVVTEATEWPRYSGRAVAGVSGFGFGGTNAHVVLREYTGPSVDVEVSAADVEVTDRAALSDETAASAAGAAVEAAASGIAADTVDAAGDVAAAAEVSGAAAAEPAVLLPVSAYLPSRRRLAATELADWMEGPGADVPLADIARALAKRNHGRSRAIVVATTRDEAIKGLRAIAAGKPGAGVFSADSPAAKGPVWVLSGFGAHHRKMAKQLYGANATFRKTVDEIDELVQDEAGYSVVEMILDDALDYDIGTSQVGVFTVQVGLAAVLREYGAEPEALVGHSQGEVAVSYLSGGLPLEDAVRVICSRSRLMGEGEAMLTDDTMRLMAIVEYSADDIGEVLADYPSLEVAVYAAPNMTVVGGAPDEVNALVAHAESVGKFNRVLQTRGAGHTSQMDPLLGELAAELAGIEPTKLKVGFFSTVDKETLYRAGHEAVHNVDYWVKNMRHSVYFTNAIRLAVESGHTTFLEVAPHSVALMQVAGTTYASGVHDAALIPTLKRKEDEVLAVLSALAQLYVHGHGADLTTLLPAGPYADIPRTSFVKKPYWIDGKAGFVGGGAGARVSLPDGRHVWESSSVADLAGHVVSVAAQVLSDVTLGASIAHAALPVGATFVTTLTPHPGGASVQVHAKSGTVFTLLYDAVVTSGAPVPVAAPVVSDEPAVSEDDVVETFGARWDPNSSESLEERLTYIIAESMGYAPEDLPVEIPLIELGLDSLMAVRIKNRVEYEFDIPQLQLEAVRDANLRDVAKYLRYAVDNRAEVQALADKQAAERAATGAAGQANVTTGGTEDAALQVDSVAESEGRTVAQTEGLAVQGDTKTSFAGTVAGDPAVAQEAEQVVAAAEASAVAKDALNPFDQQAITEAAGADVPPRDQAERLTFATWAVVTGKSAKGIFNTLEILDEDTAEKLAQRLSERTKGEVTVDDVLDAESIEQLAEVVRGQLESGGLDGFIRTLRPRPESSSATPVFVFHPAGGSTTAYEPLLKRLPAEVPMFGVERAEGTLEERARQYIPQLRKIQGDGPYVLVGWSLGGALAYAVATQLKSEGADVRLVGLVDVVMSAEPVDDSPAANRARWERYAAFAKETYGVDAPLPFDKLAVASEEEQIKIVMDLVKLSGAKIPGGIIEHQRTSWIDNRALAKLTEPVPYDGKVVLYLADRYHDGALQLEPRFANRAADGGWRDAVADLDVVYIGGDHVQIIDEPYIGKIGTDLTKRLEGLN